MSNKQYPIKTEDVYSTEHKELSEKYPSNSLKKRIIPVEGEEKKLEKIITGNVVKKKKPFFKRVAEVFIGEDVGNVGSYIVWDVLIPAFKSTVSEMVTSGVEMLMFGEARSSRTRRERGKSYVSYDKAYYGSDRNRPRTNERRERRELSTATRARQNFDEIILDSRGEGEEVLSRLTDLCVDYGQATVADLYQMVGITDQFTDNKYGWTSLANASVVRVRDGYLIELPRPILLD